MKKYQLAIATFAIIGAALVLFQDKVNALANPSGAVSAFPISCGTTATKISGGIAYNTLRCYNASSTPVYLGSSAVTTADGYEISTAATAVDAALSIDVTTPVYCVVAAGSQAIRCIGGK